MRDGDGGEEEKERKDKMWEIKDEAEERKGGKSKRAMRE